MRNKKKLEKVIALALMLGSCTCSVSEAAPVDMYGNSPDRPRDYTTPPLAGANASGYNLDINLNSDFYVMYAFGGYATNTDALSNTLNFYSGNIDEAYAGYVSGNGNANNNKLRIDGGNIFYDAYGGFTDNGTANNNIVTINGGSFFARAEVIGGKATSGGANSNVVNINADISHSNVVGGSAHNGNSDNNQINIQAGADRVGFVIGGSAHNGNSDNNQINIQAGADRIGFVVAGETSIPNTEIDCTNSHNKVVVDADADILGIRGGRIFGDDGAYKISSNGNEVIVNNGRISTILSSYTQINSSNANDESYVNAYNNSVIFNNGQARGISVVDIYDVNSSSSAVHHKVPMTISSNNLTINNGVVGDIGISIGSMSDVTESNVVKSVSVVSSDLKFENNSIDIYGGLVQNSVHGGYFVLDNLSTIQSENNTINWYGGNVNGSIHGYVYSPSSSSYSRYMPLSDSTFNFFASRSNYNKTISNLDGFQNYHFYLGPTIQAGDTLINITGYADLRDSNVGVAISANNQLEQGDSVILLSAASAGSDGGILTSGTNLPNRTSRMTAQNIYNVYDFTLRNEGGRRLVATLGNTTRNPKAENLMGIRSAEAFMTYDKVDVVDKAYQVSKHTSEPTAFIEYSYSDVTAKDDTKMRGSNVLWGIASTIGGEKDQANTLTRGIFFEYGDGTFSSIGHYPTGSIYGYGKSKKFGLGVLARKVMFDRHYYDAYLRAGTIKTDYDAFADGLGNIKYENRDMYVSGNLGYGQFIQLTPNLQMDTYIKYFYNRIPGHSTTAYTNGVEAMPISFDVFENHRFRLGSKFTWDYMESNNYKWYADVALEQEFARDQSGSINSHRISKSNGSSTTGIIELCYENKFGVNDAFMFTAKAQGYVGDRRGLGASANLSFSF